MSWIWPDHIPRELPLTLRERRKIHRRAWQLWWTNKWNFVLYLSVPAGYVSIVFFASDLGGGVAAAFGWQGPLHKACRAGAPALLLVVCFVLGGALLQRWRFAPCVYRALREHGHEVCLRCGYWLKGLAYDSERCPECGHPRR